MSALFDARQHLFWRRASCGDWRPGWRAEKVMALWIWAFNLQAKPLKNTRRVSIGASSLAPGTTTW